MVKGMKRSGVTLYIDIEKTPLFAIKTIIY